MAEADIEAEAAPLHRGLPDEIVIWEILVRLPPNSLLRCRAVCRVWRHATSTRSFLLAHHDRQPNLPVISFGRSFHAFDHRATAADDDQLRTITRLDEVLLLEASCDGLLVFDRYNMIDTRFFIYNPATRQHASVRKAGDLRIMGMYPHRPTGEYRLLLHRRSEKKCIVGDLLPEGQIGCYVFALGSDLPPRHMGWPEIAPPSLLRPTLLRGNLHWYPFESQALIVFDTIAETFRQMRVPIAPSDSSVFEMDGTLGIYNHDIQTHVVDIWVLENYESELWDFRYRIKLPAVAEIKGRFQSCDWYFDMSVVSGDGNGDVLLMLTFGQWLLRIGSDGKLVDGIHRGDQRPYLTRYRLKQTLVPHTFFTSLEGYAVNALPFI